MQNTFFSDCWHDIYISDFLKICEKNGKQTWSKRTIANIFIEFHKIDTIEYQFPGEKKCCKRITNKEKDEEPFECEDEQEKDEQRFKKTGTHDHESPLALISASKWGTTYACASKREKCVSTQMKFQKISPINCTGHKTEIRSYVLVPRTQKIHILLREVFRWVSDRGNCLNDKKVSHSCV